MKKSTSLVKQLCQGEMVASISSLILLLLLLLPWFSWENTGIVLSDSGGSHSPQGTMTIWQASSVVGYILLFSGMVSIGIAIFGMMRRISVPTWSGILLTLLGMISAGSILECIIAPPTKVDLGGIVMLNNLKITPVFWLWLGFIATVGIICGGLLMVRFQKNKSAE